jgi:anti-sigma factor ChrR (cupin superfamily)
VKHDRLDEVQCEQAATYALGALDGEEAAAFAAHLELGCEACTAEVAAFAEAGTRLALGPAARPPRPEVRARVLAGVRAGQAFEFQLADEGTWHDLGPGVSRREVSDDGRGHRSYVIRLRPGAEVRTHPHPAVEHCHVLDGDLHVAGRHLHRGDYHRAAAGTVHEGLRSDDGCLLLIVETPA